MRIQYIYKYSRCGLHVFGFNNSRFGVILLRHAARLIAHLSLLNPTLPSSATTIRDLTRSHFLVFSWRCPANLTTKTRRPPKELPTCSAGRAFHTTEVGLVVRLERHRARKYSVPTADCHRAKGSIQVRPLISSSSPQACFFLDYIDNIICFISSFFLVTESRNVTKSTKLSLSLSHMRSIVRPYSCGKVGSGSDLVFWLPVLACPVLTLARPIACSC